LMQPLSSVVRYPGPMISSPVARLSL
jgi:hypothetical protein